MGWNNDIINLIILNALPSGFSGFFVYSPSPGIGNLIGAITAAAGTDPYGNAYPAGLNFGVWNASGVLKQHFGIDSNGNLYLADNTGTTRIFSDPFLAAQLIYDATGIAAGHLIASIASAANTDTAGNAFPKGFTSFSASAPTTFYANLSAALLSFIDTVNAATSGGLVGLTTVTTANDALGLFSPLSAASDFEADIFLQRAATPGPAHVIVANSDLIVRTDTSPAAPANGVSLHSNSSHLNTVSGTAGDGNNYDVERLSKFLAADTAVPVSTNVTLFSKHVAASTYAIDGIIKGVQGAAAVGQGVQFAGPAVTFNDIYIESNAVGNTSVTDSDLTGALPVAHLTPAWGATVVFYVRFRGILTFSAAGTFTVVAQGAAGGAWTAKAASLFSLYPVVAT